MVRRALARIRRELNDAGVDALLISSLPNIRYVTGFSGSNALCLVTHQRVEFVSDVRYALQSKEEVRSARRHIVAEDLIRGMAGKKLLRGCRRVGFEADHIVYARYRLLRRTFPSIAFVPMSDVVASLATAKTPSEVAAIREAAAISGRVFHDIVELIRPGMRELEIAAEISYLHRRCGAERDAFDPIVASGPRAALPHGRASEKRIKRSELVILDFGCTVRGYNSDLTRTIAVGRASRKLREIYDVVREAQQRAIAAVRPGMAARDLDAVARDYIGARGFGKNFMHSLGHGLGLQLHERPRISHLSKDHLQAGNVITIEPGIYLPGRGGVRIEDDVCITARGAEVLTDAPREFLTV